MAEVFKFTPIKSRLWTGRYRRIPGNTSILKIRYTQEFGWWPMIEWEYGEGKATCLALSKGNVSDLADAVRGAKNYMAGNSGGSFIINEFGQVIVPSSSGDGTRMYVGDIKGPLLFNNPVNDGIINIADDERLSAGDLWDKPYLGIQYNMTRGSNIYFWDVKRQRSQYLPEQDETLITKLRNQRRSGPVRFLVNPYGIVLVKIPFGEFSRNEDQWQAVYVGRINYQYWFKRED